jgi:transposase
MEPIITYYGIDVSQERLHISYQTSSSHWQEVEIANEIQAINDWLSGLNMSQSRFIYEHTGNYSARLSYCLSLLEAHFSILTPAQSKGFSMTLKSTSKTDKQDARMLCLYGQKMQPAGSVLPDGELNLKRQKYKHLSLLKAEKQAFVNRLNALNFHPNADAIVKDSLAQTITFFEAQIQLLTQDVFTLDDDEFERIFKQMTQVVGIGKTTAHALIIATNGLKNFQSAKQVAKFIGVTPSDKQSGSSLRAKGHITKSSCAQLRTSLYMAAQNAARFNNACKNLFTRLRAKGKPYKVAIIAVIHKLIKQVFAVVSKNIIFDNEYLVAK